MPSSSPSGWSRGFPSGPRKAATIYDWTVTETEQVEPVSAGTPTGTLTVDGGVITAITGSGDLGTIGGAASDPYDDSFGHFVRINQTVGSVASYGTFPATAQPSTELPEPMSLALFGLAAVRRARA